MTVSGLVRTIRTQAAAHMLDVSSIARLNQIAFGQLSNEYGLVSLLRIAFRSTEEGRRNSSECDQLFINTHKLGETQSELYSFLLSHVFTIGADFLSIATQPQYAI